MQSSHTFTAASAVFDEYNLVSAAGLVPVLELGEQAGLSELIDAHVDLASTRVASGAANPAGKLTSIIGGMLTGADSVDDVDTIRAGGTRCCPASRTGRSSTSTRCCARCTGTRNRSVLRAREDQDGIRPRRRLPAALSDQHRRSESSAA